MNSLRYWKIDYSAVHDGPGIRTAVFFKACPLRCLWCANPEGQAVGSSLLYYQNRCAKCHRCVEVCPNHAISADDTGALSIDRSLCKLCTQCAAHCRNNALMPIGKSADVDELMREFERNRMFYRRTGGGVTFTGGEPLSQGKALVELAKRCRDSAIHTVLETCGFADNNLFRAAAQELDWIYFDLKSIDPEAHLKLTGVSNELILQNLRTASEVMGSRGKTLIVRIVVVPGITDGENLKLAAEVLSRLPFLSGVELLQYHDLGVHKYAQLSLPYPLPEVPIATKEDILLGRKYFKEANIKLL